MTYCNSKDLHYDWLHQQDRCCNAIAGWQRVYDWAYWQFRNIGIGMFKWTMPKEYPKLYNRPSRVEKYLFDEGLALAWKKPDGEFMLTKAVRYGVDEYGEPDLFIPILYNNGGMTYARPLELDECVPIWNNQMGISTYSQIRPWVERYAKVQAVLDNNLIYSNYPLLIKVKQGKDLEARIIGAIMGDLRDMVVEDGSVNPLEDLEVINLNVPYILDKLRYERNSYGDDILQAMGVNTVEHEKRERLIQAEAEANNQKQASVSGLKLQERQNAIEQIRDMFNVELGCELQEVDYEIKNGGYINDTNLQQAGSGNSQL